MALIAFKIKYYGIWQQAPISAGGGIWGCISFRGNSQMQKRKITGEFKNTNVKARRRVRLLQISRARSVYFFLHKKPVWGSLCVHRGGERLPRAAPGHRWSELEIKIRSQVKRRKEEERAEAK